MLRYNKFPIFWKINFLNSVILEINVLHDENHKILKFSFCVEK